MSFRRSSFQFSTVDPMQRYEELNKRFGFSSIIDEAKQNSNEMSPGMRDPLSISGNPRVQHRLPVFDNKQKNKDSGYNPQVRVVPIQIEGVDGNKPCGTITGSIDIANIKKETCKENKSNEYPTVGTCETDKFKKPKVNHIPVKVESNKEKLVEVNSLQSESAKKLKIDSNDSAASKCKFQKPYVVNSLKQIDLVLNKLESYKTEVERFSGSPKDKQYRYLDEMLTRCMLDLDNVETFGIDEIRLARKNAVKKIQYCIDLLDSKITKSLENAINPAENIELPIKYKLSDIIYNPDGKDPEKELLDQTFENCNKAEVVDYSVESDNLNQDCDMKNRILTDKMVLDNKCANEISKLEAENQLFNDQKELCVSDSNVENQNTTENLNLPSYCTVEPFKECHIEYDNSCVNNIDNSAKPTIEQFNMVENC